MPSLELQVATLVVAGLAVIATVIGIYVNRAGQRELAEKVRVYQIQDRDLEDLRHKFEIVVEYSDALYIQRDNYFEISIICQLDQFDLGEFGRRLEIILYHDRDLHRLRNHPEYLAALNYLEENWAFILEAWAARIRTLEEEWNPSAGNLEIPANRAEACELALKISQKYQTYGTLIGFAFASTDKSSRTESPT